MAKGTLPTSFERRGAVVGFRKPMIRHVRLRVTDDYEWEAVIPNYQGHKSQLVMDWDHLVNFTSMEDRDKALFTEINALDEEDDDVIVDPFSLRAVRIKVDKDYGETQELCQEAAKEERLDRQDRMRVYLSFLAQLTRDCGIANGDSFMANANTELLMKITQGGAQEEFGINQEEFTHKVLTFAVEKTGVDFKTVNQRLEYMSDQMAAIGGINLEAGSDVQRRTGFLARARDRLQRFRKQMHEFQKTCREEMNDPTSMIMFAAKQYLDYVTERMDLMEQKFSFFMNVIEDFDASVELVRQTRRDLSFALDGWNELIEVWEEACASEDHEKIEEAIRYILEHIPMMPEEEIDNAEEQRKVWNGYDGLRTAMVRSMTGWSDGSVDEELAKRIEEGRKRAEETSGGASGRRRRRRRKAAIS